jgi:AcrR family transcriptional regulator
MARKTTYTRDDVVAAALLVLERDGVGAVNARRVADAMNASTAPVYSNYANMEELIAAVLERATDMILEYGRRPWTEDLFLNMGVGFLHFAFDHPELFRALFLGCGQPRPQEPYLVRAMLKDLDRHPVLGDLPADHKQELLFQASIYSLGVATTMVNGSWDNPDLDLAVSWLRSVGGLLVRAALQSAGLPMPPEMEHQLGEFVVPWRQCPGYTDQEDGHED